MVLLTCLILIILFFVVDMARKKEDNSDKEGVSLNIFKHTKEETLQGVFAVIFFVLGIFFTLASFNKSGVVGETLYGWLKMLLGVGYFLLPLFFFILSLTFLKNLKRHFSLSKVVSSLLAFFSSLGIVDILLRNKGGLIGHYISAPLLKLFAVYASLVILFGILVISLLLLFDAQIKPELFMFWKRFISKKEKDSKKTRVKVTTGNDEEEEDLDQASEEKESDEEDAAESSEEDEEEKPQEKKPSKIKAALGLGKQEPIEGEIQLNQGQPTLKNEKLVPVPISLLEGDKGKPGVGDIKANANIIKRTLQNFGINVEMDEISIGPSVTRYAMKPAEGVKLSRIVALQNDLSLALAAHPLRIEAPIPGKSLVGIEVPNTTKTIVGLAGLLSSAEFQQSDKPLLFALGKGVSGKYHFANMAKMPHMLIAGATGSGKSVTIHTVITSLLYRNAPQNLKFIMIDPKRVELTLYNKIPHLLTPVITDAKKAILSLKWAAKEMDRRYDILEQNSVRDIQSYHKNVLEPALKKLEENGGEPEEGQKLPETMPYIVIVIDELADIMQTYPRELESAIVRLAQMSRAVGIHLILSTQRPSVNVITGLIKANVPARIALQVASQIDSRTILDMSGAEKLLGAGDELFMSGDMAQPVRIQSAYISETELKNVVKFIAENYEGEMPSDITLAGPDKNTIFETTLDNDSLEDDDELYEEARQIVIEAGKASTSYIQRKLRVGYARAARLMDILEERGVIGPADGAKPREVLDQEGHSEQEEPNA